MENLKFLDYLADLSNSEIALYSVIFIVLLFVIYKMLNVGLKKYKIHKDYNRKLSKSDLKIKNDLQTLRSELYKTDNPKIKNEILDKINAIVKSSG